ncbi:hypothetical protein NC661_03135 [Aquibacillus koreensis]|uniref:Uncharacterized protein n=1 Tax=Aquibacillus koreensis TaxID=279446 RepID=A0A9X3WL33_9BACI|nr:hypothetical protein [Aquibacillus koreensis]MCT2536558.1 hypothetical protein [Aquibacillus koreensis]MDC3419354.1 hypothetical protein [Aquibacillus koreensis]
MRKIIKGKIYDTKKAKLIAEYSNELPSTDFNHLYEDLYLTISGQFFLHAQGGPLTKYSESNGNETWGIETISLLNYDQTYAWLEKHDKVDEIETYFSKMIEEG